MLLHPQEGEDEGVLCPDRGNLKKYII